MEKRYDMCSRVEKYLSKNHVNVVDVNPDEIEIVINVAVEGDWKHDHLRADWLLKEAGAIALGEVVTEQDDSDYYSSIHRFIVSNDFLEEVAG